MLGPRLKSVPRIRKNSFKRNPRWRRCFWLCYDLWLQEEIFYAKSKHKTSHYFSHSPVLHLEPSERSATDGLIVLWFKVKIFCFVIIWKSDRQAQLRERKTNVLLWSCIEKHTTLLAEWFSKVEEWLFCVYRSKIWCKSSYLFGLVYCFDRRQRWPFWIEFSNSLHMLKSR